MASRSIVSRRALERLYPNADLDGFVPTHYVELVDMRSRKVIREDAILLGEPEGRNDVRYGRCPGDDEPVYAMIPPNRWQCLAQHGMVRAKPVKFVSDYVPPKERAGFVYFVQTSGPSGAIKIGWSEDPGRRIDELQTANAHKLVLLGTMPGTLDDEHQTHVRFAHLRMEAEWFRDDPEIRAFIERNAS